MHLPFPQSHGLSFYSCIYNEMHKKMPFSFICLHCTPAETKYNTIWSIIIQLKYLLLKCLVSKVLFSSFDLFISLHLNNLWHADQLHSQLTFFGFCEIRCPSFFYLMHSLLISFVDFFTNQLFYCRDFLRLFLRPSSYSWHLTLYGTFINANLSSSPLNSNSK